MRPKSVFKSFYTIIGLAFVYFIAARIGLNFASVYVNATAIWPPTGVAIAALLLWGYRLAPGVFLGAFFANLTVTSDLTSSFGIALGNTLEAMLAVYLVRRFAGGKYAFDEPAGVFSFAFFAGLLATAVSATIGVASLKLAGLVNSYAGLADLSPIWLTWWLGDLGGALVIAPLLVILITTPRSNFSLRRLANVFFYQFLSILGAVLVFSGLTPEAWQAYPIAWLTLPPLFLIAYRIGRREAVIAVTVLALIAISGTLAGYGPFAAITSPVVPLLLIQIFLAVTSTAVLMFAASVYQARQSRHEIFLRERRFRSLIENSTDMILLVDRDGGILYASPSAKKILRQEPEVLLGSVFWNLILPPDKERVMDIFSELTKASDGKTSFEMRAVFEKNKELWFEVMAQNFLSDKAVSAIILNLRDITERKNFQSDKAKFIATISHQLRAPIAQVGIYLAALLKKKDKFTMLEQKYLAEIDRVNQSMVTLVGDIIRLMQIELKSITVEARPTDLKKIIETIIQELMPKIGDRVIIKQRYPRDKTIVLIDPNLLANLFGRLLLRAADLSLEKEKVGVEILNNARDMKIGIVYSGAPSVKVSFVSFPHHTQSLWPVERRESAEDKRNVTLEFYAIQSIAELLGVKITFEPTKYGGVFYIVIPRTEHR